MKKLFMVMTIIFILSTGSTCLAQAEHDHDHDPVENNEENDMMEENHEHDMHMMDMMGNMKLMERHLIPTADGGVVVLVADTLYKYDAFLNLQFQAEIPVDYERMHEMMEMPDVQPNDNDDPHAHD